MLILESFQAGLSWECVLNKRESFRQAYDNFNIDKICNYTENKIKEFNYNNIYSHPRLDASNEYFKIIINRIYNTLKNAYDKENTLSNLEELKKFYPQTIIRFKDWLHKYWNLTDRTNTNLKNKIIYDYTNPQDYYKAIIDFIAGMTDNYAIDMYNEIVSF